MFIQVSLFIIFAPSITRIMIIFTQSDNYFFQQSQTNMMIIAPLDYFSNFFLSTHPNHISLFIRHKYIIYSAPSSPLLALPDVCQF